MKPGSKLILFELFQGAIKKYAGTSISLTSW